ncbi:MAG: hypothetical protein AAF078_14905, partial [Planctomycetota bacterium]
LFAIGETTNFFELDVTLYDPSGQLLSTTSGTNTGFRVDTLNLASSGTYTYVVREANALNDGNYTLTATVIDATIDADNVALTSGQTESGFITFGDIDTFTIDADAGDDLLFVINETTSFFALDVALYGPNGQLIETQTGIETGVRLDTFDLATSGTYTYVVREASALNDGGYSLTAVVADATV